MAYGSPADEAGIEPYFTHIRGGRPPSPEALEELIGRYRAIGGSPLASITRAQAAALGSISGRPVFTGFKHAPPFVADGAIRMGGRIPTNTHGGNLAECYSHGMTHVFEAMRQVRGTSCNQVQSARVALVVAGSSPAPTSAMLLRSE